MLQEYCTRMEESLSNESFEAYAVDFQLLISELTTCSNSTCATTGSLVDDGGDRVDLVLQQCRDLLQQMVVEARGVADPHVQQELIDRHRAYKSRWQAAQHETKREKLLFSHGTTNSDPTVVVQHEHRGALLKNLRDTEDTWDRQNATLAQASRAMQETEKVATEIVGHLSENRETLERCRANTQEVGTLAVRANQIATNLLKPWWRKGL